MPTYSTIETGTMYQYSVNAETGAESPGPTQPVTSAEYTFSRDANRHSVKVDGWRPPLPFTSDVSEYQNCTGILGYTTGYGSWTMYKGVITGSVCPSYPLNYFPPTAAMISRCETKALLKIKDQKAELGASAAELRKTVNGMASRIQHLAEGLLLLKRGRFRNAAKHFGVDYKSAVAARKSDLLKAKSKQFASNYLEWSFMWLPTLLEIKGVYELITEDTKPLHICSTYTVRENDRVRSVQLHYGNEHLYDEEIVYGVKVRLDYLVDDSARRAAARAGLDNPVSVAWELVPASWLVDYLVPIGDWLQAFTADSGLVFRGGSRTLFCEAKVQHTAKPASQAPWFWGSPQTNVHGWSRRKRVERTVYTSSPIPSLYVNKVFSGWKLANTLAYLRLILR